MCSQHIEVHVLFLKRSIYLASDIGYKGLNYAEMSLNHSMQQKDGLNETMNHDILPLIKTMKDGSRQTRIVHIEESE